MNSTKASVTVTIAGEQYSIRSDAPPDYTLQCAAYVDRTINEILQQPSLMEAHRATILAALSLADQLFRLRAEKEAMTRQFDNLAGQLADRIEEQIRHSGRQATDGLASSG
jgi:cell division protein ZapA